MTKEKIDKRRLFPAMYYRWKKKGEINIFVFYLDLILWSVPISLLLTWIIKTIVESR